MSDRPSCFGAFHDSWRCDPCDDYDECEELYLREAEDEIESDLETALLNGEEAEEVEFWGGAIGALLDG